jgi:hypothetical protein
LNGATGNVFVNSVALDAAHEGVTVAATFDNSATVPAAGWGLVAYAVCGPPAPVMTLRQTTAPVLSSSAQRNESVSCVTGTLSHGAGVAVAATAAADLGNVLVDQMRIATPASPLTSGAQAFENNATSGTWQVRAQEICAT